MTRYSKMVDSVCCRCEVDASAAVAGYVCVTGVDVSCVG